MRFWRPNLERPLALSIHPDRRDRETELTGTAIQAIEDALHVDDQNHSIKSNAREGVCMGES